MRLYIAQYCTAFSGCLQPARAVCRVGLSLSGPHAPPSHTGTLTLFHAHMPHVPLAAMLGALGCQPFPPYSPAVAALRGSAPSLPLIMSSPLLQVGALGCSRPYKIEWMHGRV